MFSLRLLNLRYFARKIPETGNTKIQISPPSTPQTPQLKDKYRRLRKTGPQLEITIILILNGNLHPKDIWRTYLDRLEEKKEKNQPYQEYFRTLNHLRETLKRMKQTGKITSCGYNREKKVFMGWKINRERSLKYVHPEVKGPLLEALKQRQLL